MAVVFALCTPEIKPGAVDHNTRKIIDCLTKAKKADIAVFPRLCITGATCGSMYSFPLLTEAAKIRLQEIAAATDKTVIIGLPSVKDGVVYDAIAVITNGETKIYYPPKGITDAGANSLCYGTDIIPKLSVDGSEIKISPDIDEDSDADIVVVPTAYPCYIGSTSEKIDALCRLKAGVIVSAGKGESVSGRIMSGDKIVCLNGKRENYGGYDEEMILTKIGKVKDRSVKEIVRRNVSFTPVNEECDLAYELMGRGIMGRMNEIGTDKVIFGLSGGLDSANVLVAAVLAFEKYKLDKKNIICVTMRGGASSRRTQNNASALIEAYKVTCINVPIDSAITLHLRSIGHEEKDVVFENAQARERTQILLDLSNKYNALMLGTGDLSEICLGWSTFGGDQLSQYDPNCSLTKTAIRALLRRYCSGKHNKAAGRIIEDILDTPVSPELISGQETESILGPYEVHDYFIEELIAKKLPPKIVLESARSKFDLSTSEIKQYLTTFLSRLFRYQFKRNFGPDGVKMFPYDLTDLVIRSDFSPELWLGDLD